MDGHLLEAQLVARRGEVPLVADLGEVGAREELGRQRALLAQLLGDGHEEADPVRGQRALAELVDQRQRVGRVVVQHPADLQRLAQERALRVGRRVGRVDLGVDGVHDAELARLRRHERADVAQEDDQAHLLEVH